MLDLNGIPVVDNHCHSMLLQQSMDTLQFHSYFSEATDASFALNHVSNSVYYLWLLRQLANIHGTGRAEDAVIAARNSQSSDDLLRSLIQATKKEELAYKSPTHVMSGGLVYVNQYTRESSVVSHRC